MALLILGLILFLGIHCTRMAAPGFRDRFVEKRGEGAWKGLYSAVSIVGFVLIVWGYAIGKPTAPVYYIGTFDLLYVTAILMLVSFILLAAAHPPAGYIKTHVKHPMLAAVILWSFGHLLVNGDLASIILFGAFLIWAVADRISEHRRRKAGITHNPTFVSVRFDIMAVVIGVVLYGLFIWKLHYWLIGVQPPL